MGATENCRLCLGSHTSWCLSVEMMPWTEAAEQALRATHRPPLRAIWAPLDRLMGGWGCRGTALPRPLEIQRLGCSCT